MQPKNVITAATHPDPYPFYAGLVEENSLTFDKDLRLWVASLLDQFKALLRTGPSADGTLAARVKAEAELAGWNSVDSLLANLIGLLSQTYQATAGLIGNTLVALATQPGLEEALRGSPESLPGAVEEVNRFDPPVQNTRRFVTQSTCIAGRQLHPGDVIVLVLAAANRDPALNGRPHEFVPDRPDRRILGFGHGRHACPGQLLAGTIAASAIEVAMDSLSTSEITSLEWQYRPSVNGRIPLFRNPETIKE